MTFKLLSTYFHRLEEISSRNQMVEILADLFNKAKSDEIGSICYLLQGRVGPLYLPLEFGMADKMIIRSLAVSSGLSTAEISRLFKKEGDLGVVAEKLAENENLSLFKKVNKELSVKGVFNELTRLAKASGGGSQETKINILANLLGDLDALSCRYIVRIPTAKLRLGFSDMTMLDALSYMLKKDKSVRPEIEAAYNVRPDLGFIAETTKEKGIAGLKKVIPCPGTPIIMARAERLNSAVEIIDKIGKCAIEPKMDGFRLAIHKNNQQVKMFSRNMEEVTFMYPDLVEAVLSQVKTKEAIFEGEALAFNPKTREFLPFQETVQRKRKYNIEKTALEIPLKLICFDCLYIDGKSLISSPFTERRRVLNTIITQKDKETDRLILSELNIVDNPKDLEKLFNDAISRGLEGVIAKKLNGIYRAGARDFNWIKYKRGFAGRKLTDTIDCLAMGYDSGQGKRTAFGIGDFLIGVYDSKSDMFKTIAKIGTGLSDDEWREMAKRLQKIKSKEKPVLYNVDKMMTCDFWAKPEVVVVIKADEITRSPVHTCGRAKDGQGYALRFPRLVEFRSDKKPEDTTSEKEIIEMYREQFK